MRVQEKAHDVDAARSRIDAVNDALKAIANFAKLNLTELGNHRSAFGMLAQGERMVEQPICVACSRLRILLG